MSPVCQKLTLCFRSLFTSIVEYSLVLTPTHTFTHMHTLSFWSVLPTYLSNTAEYAMCALVLLTMGEKHRQARVLQKPDNIFSEERRHYFWSYLQRRFEALRFCGFKDNLLFSFGFCVTTWLLVQSYIIRDLSFSDQTYRSTLNHWSICVNSSKNLTKTSLPVGQFPMGLFH